MEARKIIITGGATRIGAAIAEKLSGPNVEITIHYNRSKTKAENLKNKLQEFGTKVYLVKGDLSKEKDIHKIIKFSKSKMKFFDCLVNNASLFENDKLENFSSKSWEKHISINLKAPALLSKEFSKNIQGKNNNIINIIDQRVFKLTPFFFSYTLSKTGLYTLTKTSAMSLSPKIRVNSIAPGPTIKNKRQSEKHFKSQYLATPLKKQVDVIEICNAVDFFLKNRSITGQVLAIDSGQSLNWQTPDIIKGKEWKKNNLKIIKIDKSKSLFNYEKKILINELLLDLKLGYYDFEKEKPQKVKFGLEIDYQDKKPSNDKDIKSIVNYSTIVKLITKLVKKKHYNFLETLAESVFDELFKDKRIAKIMLKIEKMEILKECSSVGIQITKKRSHDKFWNWKRSNKKRTNFNS